jgi:hypothetical protein
MTTRLLVTTVLLGMSSLALAQQFPAGPPGFDIDKLEVLLDLDAYQKAEVQKVLETRRDAKRAQREQLRSAETRLPFEQMQEKREAAQTQARAQLAKILSAQQLKKFDVLNERPQLHVQGGL